MTCTNYPFNAIWAIVQSSIARSRTFPPSLTQKHQIEKSLVSKHSRNTGRSRAFVSRSGHFKIVVVYPEFSAWQEGARVRRRPARDYTRLNGHRRRGEARYVSLPASLRKSPIATVLSLTTTILWPKHTIAILTFETYIITHAGSSSGITEPTRHA